jgi:hypothetical protein
MAKRKTGEPAAAVPAPCKRYPPHFKAAIMDDLEGYFQWNAARAGAGDATAGREMLHGFCDAVEEQRPIPKAICRYLWLAFSDYLSGASSIDKALHLKRPARRPRGTGQFDPIQVVAALYLYQKRDGLGKDKAKGKVAEHFGIAETRTVERFDKEWNLIADLSIEDLELLAQPVAAARRGDNK